MIWSSSEGRSADKARELLLFGRRLRLPFLQATSQQMFSACSLDQRGTPDMMTFITHSSLSAEYQLLRGYVKGWAVEQ